MVRFVKINLSALLLAVALAATAGAAPLKDNGTGPDGIFIIRQSLPCAATSVLTMCTTTAKLKNV